MPPFRLRIALLALGVLFGYGSAFAHFAQHHRDCHDCDDACYHYDHHHD